MMTFDAHAFLKAYGFDLDALLAGNLLDEFRSAMTDGLAGLPGGLPMLPAYVAPLERIPAGRPVIAIDAGGTHLRVGIVTFDANGKPAVSHFERYDMPATGSDEPLDADGFFTQLAHRVRPFADASDRIGFCFSYATDILPDGDGRLRHWSKEVNAPEVVGRQIGAELLRRLDVGGRRKHRVMLLNDTVACLLVGAAEGTVRHCSAPVGFILGTGVNVSYVERNRRIAAARECPPDGRQAINVESGTFARAPASRFDDALDAASNDPGAYRFEKMVSGAYLGRIGLRILRQAAEDGCFSPSATDTFLSWRNLSTKEMDDFIANPFAPNKFGVEAIGCEDRRKALALCQPVTARAAWLAAVNLAAAVIMSHAGQDPLHPVCVNIDGSTYYRTWGLPERLQAHLRAWLDPLGIHIHLVRTADAPLIGAALAGLAL